MPLPTNSYLTTFAFNCFAFPIIISAKKSSRCEYFFVFV